MFDNYDQTADNVLHHAEKESLALKHEYISVDHLVLGLIKANGPILKLFKLHGVEPKSVYHQIRSKLKEGITLPSNLPPISPRAKLVLDLAEKSRVWSGSKKVSEGHLLKAILEEGNTVSCEIIENMFTDYREFTWAIAYKIYKRRRYKFGTDYKFDFSFLTGYAPAFILLTQAGIKKAYHGPVSQFYYIRNGKYLTGDLKFKKPFVLCFKKAYFYHADEEKVISESGEEQQHENG